MIGIVVVSHSRPLAEAAVALASGLLPAGPAPEIAVAAGTTDGGFGTDAAAISVAIKAVDSDAGVLVLLDGGSAIMSAELAVRFLDADLADRVVISSGPLVEGLLAAVTAAASGVGLDAVAVEARQALVGKARRLNPDGATSATPLRLQAPRPQAKARPVSLTWRTPVNNEHGLHIRPSAAIVTSLRGLNADVLISNATTGRGPAAAGSLSALAALEIRRGHVLEARITGPDAEKVRNILADLAARDFGETSGRRRPPRAPREPAASELAVGNGATPAPTASGTQIVVGPIHRRTSVPAVDGYHPGSPKIEFARFNDAVEEVEDYLDALALTRTASAGILHAQSLLASDRELAHAVVGRITEGFSAVDAVVEHLTGLARELDALTDPYLRERAQDVRSVRRLLLLALMRKPLAEDDPGEPCVWLVEELDAATATRLDQRLCLGVITTTGGAHGHGALTAEARGIPVLTGREDARALAEGRHVAFDPVTRELWLDPDPTLVTALERLNAERMEAAASALSRAHEPAYTLDGRRVLVEANVSSLADALAAAAAGAEGSGVVRTEILFAARRQAPTAEEQAEVYVALGKTIGGPLSIRTWDAGGDKPVAFFTPSREPNPALGERGIRTMRKARDLFAEQLRGIAMAARETPIRVMFPMVTRPEEVSWARGVLDEALAGLGPVELPVGIMVEVPAAAIRAADFAGLVDFVSIGTNDLAQYTLASDRTNAAVSRLSSLDDPAVWDLIELTCRGLPGKPIAVCGSIANEPDAVARLVGLGVSELSVRPPMVAQIKQAVRQVSE